MEGGWITKKRAREVYGVVLDKEGEVDEAVFSEMRKRLKKRHRLHIKGGKWR